MPPKELDDSNKSGDLSLTTEKPTPNAAEKSINSLAYLILMKNSGKIFERLTKSLTKWLNKLSYCEEFINNSQT